MKLSKEQIINTGGNCMALVIPVENGGNLKSIVINEEGIVAYSHPQPFDYDGDFLDLMLWETRSWEELMKTVGVEVAMKIHRIFKDQWQWHDFLDEEHIIESYVALRDFTTAAALLTENWHEELDAGYPFNKSFDELVVDIYNWQQVAMEKYQK